MAWPRLHRADHLGLPAAPGRPVAAVVAGMVFLAALAAAGTLAASDLARRWRGAAGQATIVQVPRPAEQAGGTTREAAVAGLLGTGARLLSQAEVEARLRPWLGADAGRLGTGLPAVFAVKGALPAGSEARLDQAAPGTLVSRGAEWQAALLTLARSLVACFWLVLAVVGGVAAAVVAIATQAGLAARRDALEIVHGLGATDAMIAGRLAGRMALLVLAGAAAGALAAVPLLLALAGLTAPFGTGTGLPPDLWLLLAMLPPAACGIGWVAAQASVRAWLRRLA